MRENRAWLREYWRPRKPRDLQRGRYLQEMGWSSVLPTWGWYPLLPPNPPPLLPLPPPTGLSPLTPPSLVKQVDSTPITAKPVGRFRGPPGQGPRGVWGRRRVTPGAELLPGLELMAQFRDALLFLEEENNWASGRQEVRKGWGREREAEDNVWETQG